MLDIQFIRENKKEVQKAAKNKGINVDIDALLKLDDERRKLQVRGDTLRAKKNELAEKLKDADKRSEAVIKEGKKIKDDIAKLEKQEREGSDKFKGLMLRVPNIPSDDTPVGLDESANKEIAKVGKPTKFNFEPKDHITLGTELDMLDLERGVKVGGFRGYVLKNEGAQMQLAILQYAFNKLIEKGFTPFVIPSIVKGEALENMGQFPAHKAETFMLINPEKVNDGKKYAGTKVPAEKEDRYLAGTSEVALLSYYAEEILEKEQLPIKMCGFSPCFRSEVGSYGKDTKGLYRVQEFWKVEQVILAENNLKKSLALLEELRGISEEILKDLELSYHVIITSTGDQGQGKYKMYDIETWMPSRNNYGETHSDSLLTDWQARRANIRYKDGNETKYVHTLNNTAIASPRILIAIWENYQNKDGSIDIPQVLRPYMSNQKRIEKK